MNRRLFNRSTKTYIWLIAALIISIIICSPKAVRADDKIADNALNSDIYDIDDSVRFSTNSDKRLFSTGKLQISFNYKEHKDEELKIKLSSKRTAEVYIGKWSGDSISILIVPKQDRTITLTARCGDETIKFRLFLKVERERTPEEIYEHYSKAMVEIKATEANSIYTGAGFFIGDRVVLTNYHVIEYARSMTITDYDGKSYRPNGIIALDKLNDIAIIKVEDKNTAAFDLCKDRPKGGADVYTMGSPLELTGSFASGIVSCESRILDDIDYIQMTNAVSMGSGGGPLIDTKGEVLGITTLTVKIAQNVNFALPTSYVQDLKPSPMTMKEFYEENKDKIREPEKHTYTIIW